MIYYLLSNVGIDYELQYSTIMCKLIIIIQIYKGALLINYLTNYLGVYSKLKEVDLEINIKQSEINGQHIEKR